MKTTELNANIDLLRKLLDQSAQLNREIPEGRKIVPMVTVESECRGELLRSEVSAKDLLEVFTQVKEHGGGHADDLGMSPLDLALEGGVARLQSLPALFGLGGDITSTHIGPTLAGKLSLQRGFEDTFEILGVFNVTFQETFGNTFLGTPLLANDNTWPIMQTPQSSALTPSDKEKYSQTLRVLLDYAKGHGVFIHPDNQKTIEGVLNAIKNDHPEFKLRWEEQSVVTVFPQGNRAHGDTFSTLGEALKALTERQNIETRAESTKYENQFVRILDEINDCQQPGLFVTTLKAVAHDGQPQGRAITAAEAAKILQEGRAVAVQVHTATKSRAMEIPLEVEKLRPQGVTHTAVKDAKIKSLTITQQLGGVASETISIKPGMSEQEVLDGLKLILSQLPKMAEERANMVTLV